MLKYYYRIALTPSKISHQIYCICIPSDQGNQAVLAVTCMEIPTSIQIATYKCS